MPSPRPSASALLAGAGAFLLPVAYSPAVAAHYWSPKAAVALVLGSAGLGRLPALWRSDLRRPAVAATAVLVAAAVSTAVSSDPLQALVGLNNAGTGLLFVASLVGVWALGATSGRRGRGWSNGAWWPWSSCPAPSAS